MRETTGRRGSAKAWLLAAALLLTSAAGIFVFAEKQAQPLPKAFHANTYPAHESHDDEKVSIAVDPYDMPDKAAIFVVDYRSNGLLPMQFIISNDSGQAISLVDMEVELITADRSKIPPATVDDLYRRLGRQTRRGDESTRTPVPLPRRRAKPTVSREAQAEIESMQFRARAVEAHSLQSGFLIFDVADIPNPLAGARLYVHGLRDQNGKELFYFEIPLEKYLNYRPGHP